MKRTIGQRAAVTVAAAALAVGGSALLGGVAFAGGHGGDDSDAGNGGRGATTNITCVFHGPSEAGVNGHDGRAGQCSPDTNGGGGDGGSAY